MPEGRKSLKERLLEVLEDDEGDGRQDEEDMIVLRGPSARRLLGLLDGEPEPPRAGDPAGEGGDGDPAPEPEPAPQRTHSRYFGDK